jgi:hypothetical protein
MADEKSVVLADLVKELLPEFEEGAQNGIHSVGELNLQMLGDALDYGAFCEGACFCDDPYNEPPEEFAFDVSSCIVRNGYVEGMLLVKKEKDGSLSPVLLFYSGDDVRDRIREMTAHSIRAASAQFPMHTPITIRFTDPRVKEQLSFLYGRKEYERIAGIFQ